MLQVSWAVTERSQCMCVWMSASVQGGRRACGFLLHDLPCFLQILSQPGAVLELHPMSLSLILKQDSLLLVLSCLDSMKAVPRPQNKLFKFYGYQESDL